VAAEIAPAPEDAEAWRGGAQAEVSISTADGAAAGSATAALTPGARSLLAKVPLDRPGAPSYVVRVRLRPADRTALPVSETIELRGQDAGAAAAVLWRRGPSTGNQYVPAADYRFRRTDRIRLEVPVPEDAGPGTGSLLDRNGKPLDVPLTLAARDADGVRWIVADLTLAPLTAGDYVIEIAIPRSGGETRVLTPLRIER
jgi:hypothetical protein